MNPATPTGFQCYLYMGDPVGLAMLALDGFFDPQVFRIIIFDQRGCGRSIPHGFPLTKKTTDHLISDIEKVREHLEIDKWILFGGVSRGSTLSLLYAQAYPERVSALILRAFFFCRQGDLDWVYKDGANRIFPDYWEDFLKPIAESERGGIWCKLIMTGLRAKMSLLEFGCGKGLVCLGREFCNTAAQR
ncbi:MAG: hypothetical protein CM1200mP40_24840 [Gammaproteobacteria bacterium]|nr:MAG: hypothetical protein CM1200mP40_24840 [Gammaproteobacteria bacterium]